MSSYTVTINDWLPTALNKLMACHWSKRSKLKNSDYSIINTYVRSAHIPASQCKRRVHVTLTYAKGGRFHDSDAIFKVLCDGLVKAYAIWDDSPKYCELMPVIFKRGERKSTTIEITDIE